MTKGSEMTDDAWIPPTTHELVTTDGRRLAYCLYGPADGRPVVSLSGAPGTRWERPDVIEAITRAGLRVLVHDRPGYGRSTRQPGRTVGDVATDVRLLADAQGWNGFAITGHSGGGPHALACAALLSDRVTRCAVVACLAPADAAELDFFGSDIPGRGASFRLAAHGEEGLRAYLTERVHTAMARFEAERPAGPGQSSTSTGTAPDPGRRARIRAMFLDGLHGWIDDTLALARPWGFDPKLIDVPVSVWFGTHDDRIPRSHIDWLLAHLTRAESCPYPGGHEPGAADHRRVLGWLRQEVS